MKIPFFRQIAWCLVAAMFVIGIVPRVEAGLSSSEIINTSIDRATDIAKIQAAIETKMVKERLEQLGYTTEEIEAKLGQLSDGQIHQVALKIDDINTGGNGGVELVAAVLAIIILIWLLFWLMGHKVVVKE